MSNYETLMSANKSANEYYCTAILDIITTINHDDEFTLINYIELKRLVSNMTIDFNITRFLYNLNKLKESNQIEQLLSVTTIDAPERTFKRAIRCYRIKL